MIVDSFMQVIFSFKQFFFFFASADTVRSWNLEDGFFCNIKYGFGRPSNDIFISFFFFFRQNFFDH